MKANELRIGNWIKFDNHLGDKRDVLVTPRMFRQLGMDLSENLNLELNGYHLPIPLTDEWLVRFGFKNRFLEVICQNNKVLEIEFDGTNDNIYQTEICVYERIIVDGETESDKVNYININHIKHVHQLQNLYFALTGDELSHE